MSDNALARFSAATQEWFTSNFVSPTPAQVEAWQAISSGQHTLVVAPTGSGKTLAAFLWALDQLAMQPVPEPAQRCRVLYISPLKALVVDVERNLREPLTGIEHAAQRLGATSRDVCVAVRTGDSSPSERRAFARNGADILVTTPESLFLLLTSAARESLRGVETVIIDEIHALAGTKRGAHLALSLERLDAQLGRPAQRVGLSATVRPIAEVARFLAGGRPVSQVTPASSKLWDLSIVVPVADLTDLGAAERGVPKVTGADGPGSKTMKTKTLAPTPPDTAAGEQRRVFGQTSIWPHVEERIVDAIAAHRSTLVFVNARRVAERLTARLNEIWAQRLDLELDTDRQAFTQLPAEVMAQSALGHGAPAILARAHHGSISREQRSQTEEDLKAGRLPAVVATSSLELGIDMGAIDLVIQVEAPLSVASGLQRVGRAGHQVGAVSRGIYFPKFRGDLLQTAVAVERMRCGQIEALHIPTNPLDVLAQQIVAMVAMDTITVGELASLVRRAAPFTKLTDDALTAVLDMLAGRYPSADFAELRPRLVWDRTANTLTGRPNAQRLAVTSGGTIPDRGLFGVFIADQDAAATTGGRRVGELDEEMVYESRVGDVIALGTSSWLITDITHDHVLVTPAPGRAARLPFWKGDSLGRSAEFGRAIGSFVRELSELKPAAARTRLAELGLDEWASDNLLNYLDDQREAIGRLPHDRQLVVERFRDELGDWRVVVHSPFGAGVHAPWALIAAARLRERYQVDVQAMHADDGMVFRIPDTDWDGAASNGADLAELLTLIFPDPEDVAAAVQAELVGSALFAARFRECAGRALLLPNRRPGKRQALWQQRLRAAQLLSVASGYPDFPIVLETVRECVNDVFDVPALTGLLTEIRSRKIATIAVETDRPSPFAASLQFGYVAQFLYEGDSPLAERRAAALSLNPTLLAQLLGTSDGLALAELLDPETLTATEAQLQRLSSDRQTRDAEDLCDLLRVLAPLSTAELCERSRDPASIPAQLATLATQHRIFELPDRRWAVVEDAARLRDGLGIAVPGWVPDALLAPPSDPVADLLLRYARGHAVFDADEVAAWLGISATAARERLAQLAAAGRLAEGDLRPAGWRSPTSRTPASSESIGYCDIEVLRLLRRRSLAALRQQVEPVSAAGFARFLLSWQNVGNHRGVDGVLEVATQLAGVRVPASALETLILPSRVVDYSPAMLDELTASGELFWQGHGCIGATDGWISLHPAETAASTLAEPDAPRSEAATAVLAAMGDGGHFFAAIAQAAGLPEGQLAPALWELVWCGQLTNDTFAGLRVRLGQGRAAHRVRTTARRGRHRPTLSGAPVRRISPPEMAGRWSALPKSEPDFTTRLLARSELLLARYGILTRGSIAAEEVDGGFAGIYPVLAAAEDAGRIRRGYFIEGLGAAQFGGAGAVDRLRDQSRIMTVGAASSTVVLAATDPANPYGAALPWPTRPGGHQPGRKAGAVVVLVSGQLALYLERGGHSLLSWSQDLSLLTTAAQALAQTTKAQFPGTMTLTKLNDETALGSAQLLTTALLEAGFTLTPKGLRIAR
jgi:ATP-dependent helicase Lhr and Lhr-like helicase